jgi:hypothetical protein
MMMMMMMMRMMENATIARIFLSHHISTLKKRRPITATAAAIQ